MRLFPLGRPINQSLTYLLKHELRKPENLLYRQGELSRERLNLMKNNNNQYRLLEGPVQTKLLPTPPISRV